MVQNHKRVWEPFLGTKKKGFRDKGLLFTTCLYKIQSHAVHTHPYTMECNCREHLSYFFSCSMFICGWIMGIAMGWLGLVIECFAGMAKNPKIQQLPS